MYCWSYWFCISVVCVSVYCFVFCSVVVCSQEMFRNQDVFNATFQRHAWCTNTMRMEPQMWQALGCWAMPTTWPRFRRTKWALSSTTCPSSPKWPPSARHVATCLVCSKDTLPRPQVSISTPIAWWWRLLSCADEFFLKRNSHGVVPAQCSLASLSQHGPGYSSGRPYWMSSPFKINEDAKHVEPVFVVMMWCKGS